MPATAGSISKALISHEDRWDARNSPSKPLATRSLLRNEVLEGW